MLSQHVRDLIVIAAPLKKSSSVVDQLNVNPRGVDVSMQTPGDQGSAGGEHDTLYFDAQDDALMKHGMLEALRSSKGRDPLDYDRESRAKSTSQGALDAFRVLDLYDRSANYRACAPLLDEAEDTTYYEIYDPDVDRMLQYPEMMKIVAPLYAALSDVSRSRAILSDQKTKTGDGADDDGTIPLASFTPGHATIDRAAIALLTLWCVVLVSLFVWGGYVTMRRSHVGARRQWAQARHSMGPLLIEELDAHRHG